LSIFPAYGLRGDAANTILEVKLSKTGDFVKAS
jgi:hypothetical protein